MPPSPAPLWPMSSSHLPVQAQGSQASCPEPTVSPEHGPHLLGQWGVAAAGWTRWPCAPRLGLRMPCPWFPGSLPPPHVSHRLGCRGEPVVPACPPVPWPQVQPRPTPFWPRRAWKPRGRGACPLHPRPARCRFLHVSRSNPSRLSSRLGSGTPRWSDPAPPRAERNGGRVERAVRPGRGLRGQTWRV